MLLIANWKMAPDKPVQASDLAKKSLAIAKAHKALSIIACVPYIHLTSVIKVARAPLAIGAQSVASTIDVAQTGLVNALMLKGYGVTHCIVGHSESRKRGDTNEEIGEQSVRLLEKQIIPILCIGEKSRDAHGWHLSEVKEQIEAVLNVVQQSQLKKIIIAYEPVWAIGKDALREATPKECNEMIIFIRKVIADHAGEKIATSLPIIYGGSVNELNARYFVADGGVGGFLVGRVSLEPKRFAALADAIDVKKK